MLDSRVLVDKVQKVSHKCLLVHMAPTGQTRDDLNRKRTMEGTEYKKKSLRLSSLNIET